MPTGDSAGSRMVARNRVGVMKGHACRIIDIEASLLAQPDQRIAEGFFSGFNAGCDMHARNDIHADVEAPQHLRPARSRPAACC